MRAFANLLSKTMVWLTAALMPLVGLPGGSCLCGSAGGQAPGGRGPAALPAQVRHACCHGGTCKCCKNRASGGCCCCCAKTARPQTNGGAVCLCSLGSAPKPAIPPAGNSPTLKHLLSQVGVATVSAATIAPPAAAGHWQVLVLGGTSPERLSNLCRLNL
jgi:hypothetical protein